MTQLANTLQQDVLPAYIELFELDCTAFGGSIYRFTNSIPTSGSYIPFGGLDYQLVPIHFSGLNESSDGSQPRPTLQISNVNKVLLGAVIALGDIVGAKVTRIRTFETFLDTGATPDSTQRLVDVFYISQKTGQDKQFITFELCTGLERAQLRLPRRQCLKKLFPGIGGSSYR